MPGQSIPAVLLSYFSRSNIPASIVGVWLSNPITTPFILYVQFKVGMPILTQLAPVHSEKLHSYMDKMTWSELQTIDPWDLIKQSPFVLIAVIIGAVVTAVILSIVAYPLAYWSWGLLTQWVKNARIRRKDLKRGGGAQEATVDPENEDVEENP